MRLNISAASLAVVVGIVFFAVVHGEQTTTQKMEMGDATLVRADTIHWQEGPPSLPKGAMIAVLEGDPGKEGPFVFRIKVPDGYRVQPHFHPKIERLTVISGTLYFGMGDKFDEKAGQAMPAGSYGQWPAGMKHFAWGKGETVLQLHGMGPWGIEYVNAADDPRQSKK